MGEVPLYPLASCADGGRVGIDEGLSRRYKATLKRGFKLAWREAGPPNHLDDKVDSDQ